MDPSRNGTRVNAAWVRGTRPLAAGDRIYLGSRVIAYQPEHAPVAALQHDPTLIDARAQITCRDLPAAAPR